jgi:hypothetical protein
MNPPSEHPSMPVRAGDGSPGVLACTSGRRIGVAVERFLRVGRAPHVGGEGANEYHLAVVRPLCQIVVDGASTLLGEIAAPRFGRDWRVREARVAADETITIDPRAHPRLFVRRLPEPVQENQNRDPRTLGQIARNQHRGTACEIARAFELHVEHVEPLGAVRAGARAARGKRCTSAIVGGGEERPTRDRAGQGEPHAEPLAPVKPHAHRSELSSFLGPARGPGARSRWPA